MITFKNANAKQDYLISFNHKIQFNIRLKNISKKDKRTQRIEQRLICR